MGNLCDTTIKQQVQQTSLITSSKELESKFEKMNTFSSQPQKIVTLNDFIILGSIGKGAFGKVFKVKRKDNNKIYAMKQIAKDNLFKHKLENNAVLERDVLKKSKHPFIVQLKYSFQTPQMLYFIMEYISGGEFYKILNQTRGLPENVVRYVGAEVVLALEYLNTKLKVIYRDLKPENILLSTTGHVKLTDFGLATTIQDNVNKKQYTLAGTAEYLAPEIVTRSGHSFEVDLWTLGILLYEMINGYPPFQHPERNMMKIQEMIKINRPQFPSTMSLEAKDLIQKLLRTEPKERLGARSYKDIKDHAFFSTIRWDQMSDCKIKSPLKRFAEETTKKNNENLSRNVRQTIESPNVAGPIKHVSGITYNGGEGETYNSLMR